MRAFAATGSPSSVPAAPPPVDTNLYSVERPISKGPGTFSRLKRSQREVFGASREWSVAGSGFFFRQKTLEKKGGRSLQTPTSPYRRITKKEIFLLGLILFSILFFLTFWLFAGLYALTVWIAGWAFRWGLFALVGAVAGILAVSVVWILLQL